MKLARARWFLTSALCPLAFALVVRASPPQIRGAYEVYAIPFAHVPFRTSQLVAGADHADGVDLFPRETVWIQREEYEHYIWERGAAKDRAIDPADAEALDTLRTAGRVRLVEGDGQVVLPGITVYTGGKHTFASKYVGVVTRSGTVILASDNAYLYENLERHLAIAQTLDATSSLAAQAYGVVGLSGPAHRPRSRSRGVRSLPDQAGRRTH